MRILTTRRLGACLALTLATAALAAPAAHASTTSALDVGATLLDQPKGQPWAVDLLLGGSISSSGGRADLPITTNIQFQFPKAQVNSSAFTVCRASDADLLRRGPSACPASSKIGAGTAIVVALGLPFNASLQIFNGKGNNSKREILLYARATDPGVDVIIPLRGTLQKISSGNFGYKLNLPIPDIRIVGEELASIETFNVTVGKRVKKGGRKVAFIDAPTKCPAGGWPFTITVTLKNGEKPTDRKAINCTLKAT